MSETSRPRRKRSNLREMADFAFDEAHRIRTRTSRMVSKGVSGYPRTEDIIKVNRLEDICNFIDAVKDLDGHLKDEIRKQIVSTKQRKAAQEKLGSDEMTSEQNG